MAYTVTNGEDEQELTPEQEELIIQLLLADMENH